MTSCLLIRKHIDAFVDGELDPATQIEFERHLAVCSGCQEVLLVQRAFKAELKRRLAGPAAPESLKLRLAAALEAAPLPATQNDVMLEPSAMRSSHVPPLVRWVRVKPSFQLSAAAAILLAVAFGSYFSSGDRSDHTLAGAMPIFEDVVRRHTASQPSEVSGVPPREVTNWFRGKVEFPVRPVEFGDPRARLVGARISSVNGREAATLVYDVGGQRVTVVVLEPTEQTQLGEPVRGMPTSAPVYYQQVRGYTVAVMPRDGVTYMATGDVGQGTLLRLVTTAHIAH